MFLSTPSSNSTSKGLPTRRHHANGPLSALPTPPNFLARSKIPLSQRIQQRINQLQGRTGGGSPIKEIDVSNAGVMGKPSSSFRVSPSPVKFGGERMQRAKSGHFKRPSLETNCLTAKGEDAAQFFEEPLSIACPRENSSNSYGEGSSFNSSSNINFTLHSSRVAFSPSKIPVPSPNMESPLSRVATAQIRARVRGHHTRVTSRSFAHETIHEMQEEVHQEANVKMVESPSVLGLTSLQLTTPNVGPCEGSERHTKGKRDKRKTLERYCALKHEAELTVTESKKEWVDTPYSIVAVQNFQPPKDVKSMQTLLEDSMKTYRPLPSEFRAHRRRNSRNLRSSPYAQARLSRASMSSVTSPIKCNMASPSPSLARVKRMSAIMDDTASPGPFSSPSISVAVLQGASGNPHLYTTPASMNEAATKPLRHFNPVDKTKEKECEAIMKGPEALEFLTQGTPTLKSRSSIPSNVCQPQTPVKGLTKRDRKNKENVNEEMLRTPGGSLRIDRPRPRYRTPTPGPKRRPAKS